MILRYLYPYSLLLLCIIALFSLQIEKSSGLPNNSLSMNEGHVFTYVLPTLLF